METIHYLSLETIVPNVNNPRDLEPIDDPQFQALIASIKLYGIIQPLLVDGECRLIAGHRRYAAAKYLEMSEVPAIMLDDKVAGDAGLIIAENVHRRQFSIIELATLLNEMKDEPSVIADRTGLSLSTVESHLNVFSLPMELIDFVQNDQLALGAINLLARSTLDRATVIALGRRAAQNRWTIGRLKSKMQQFKKQEPVIKDYAEQRQEDLSWCIDELITVRVRLERYRGSQELPTYATKIENQLQAASRDIARLIDAICESMGKKKKSA